MCGGPERSKPSSSTSLSAVETSPNFDSKGMNNVTVKNDDSFSCILELAADNNVEGFKRSIEQDPSLINEFGPWYSRQKSSKQIVLDHRTPLMVAATYGSLDVLQLIVSLSEADVNLTCGRDNTTALHCAASGGSINAVDAVKLLITVGADSSCVDANGHSPIDVILVPPKQVSMKVALEKLLSDNASDCAVGGCSLRVSIGMSNSSSSTLSSSMENGSLPSPSDLISSPMSMKFNDLPISSAPEKKEYPIEPSFPDIKNSIYSTDDFRMYSFKVRPCSRAYSHDWTECPFVHPGENARRRDPRKYHYSCVPCPDFRKGACRRGDMCEYAHGVFECWLHPAQYRTRLCKDGTGCNRRVCFFAHTAEELRPLYVSTGSAVPSPRASASAASVMDMATALNLLPGSPSSVSSMLPSPFAQPMSPSGNGISHPSGAWPPLNVPTLHLPGSSFQSSRLRSSLSARDILPPDFNMLPDYEAQQHILNDLNCFSQTRNISTPVSRSGLSKMLTPSNLDELFSSEVSFSPRYADQAAGVFSPTHKPPVLGQFQQQQSMLSPINTSVFSPKNVEHPLLQASFGVGSPGRMSPRSVESMSPIGSRLSAFSQREKQQQQLRSLSSRDLGSNISVPVVGSPADSWSKWGSPSGKIDWSVNKDEPGVFKRPYSFEIGNDSREPDLSWVQSLVKESPPEMVREKLAVVGNAAPSSSGEGLNPSSQVNPVDNFFIESWLEQTQIDQQQLVV
ncbi:CCCH-type zinc finger protein with ARM repeat domain isoform 1 [Tripterygium wilfordii]|uniref:CCCH-type zinc finger protein with ARM repeat domain isoform 1 n=1 Tax=Tripterygium wilfordii TaxID=458696 RepID=A0A7J7CW98_TRIWF|nr:zinc finger CCCH domain-containing protein 30-like [Tripterygium wilfordii]KAF5738377.1 CCCH-type zinc finger protein with ARM repeat domain isoform 1 [Tripterygium wilfordii]